MLHKKCNQNDRIIMKILPFWRRGSRPLFVNIFNFVLMKMIAPSFLVHQKEDAQGEEEKEGEEWEVRQELNIYHTKECFFSGIFKSVMDNNIACLIIR